MLSDFNNSFTICSRLLDT